MAILQRFPTIHLGFSPFKDMATFSPMPRSLKGSFLRRYQSSPSQNRRMASPGPFFTSDENVGLFVLAGTASLSATAIIGLLSYIVVSCTSLTLGMSIDDY